MLPDSVITKIAHSRLGVPLKRIVRHWRERYYNAEVVNRIQNKTRPVKLVVDDRQPRRINLIVPEISFSSFYGGYIAKMNLCARLVALGYRVRVVIVDQCDVHPDKLRGCVRDYPGIDDIFERVDVAYVFDREQPLICHSGDGVIATTWWTAYIADAMVEHLDAEQFVYMIQEYEPFTFPMGSYFAVAHNSYDLAHRAMFSSELLRDYFRRQHIGVFADGAKHGDFRSRSFENAIVAFDDDELTQKRRRSIAPAQPRKLLFYARPEAHATRNMFEIGYVGLNRAIEQGVFDDEPWSFHGIGTRHGDMPLAGGRQLKMIGKLDLEAYRKALLDYDLGLSLMYTPHPSLLPLEMAAAAMIVVSSECLNKNQENMALISANLITAKASVDGVATALAKARSRVARGDVVWHQPVHWSQSWQTTFDAALMSALVNWLGFDATENIQLHH